jgi:hypothetical protein
MICAGHTAAEIGAKLLISAEPSTITSAPC